MKVVSLFTGAGGLDLGFEAAGFETVACVERDNDARATILKNRPQWGLLREGDIASVRPCDLAAQASAGPGDVDVIIGGPPCQPFSKAALWSTGQTLGMEDPRSRTISAMLGVVETMLPRAVVIENVRGFASRGNNDALTLIEKAFRSINRKHRTGYKVHVALLSATDFGVPQIRERAFVVAFRDGQRFSPPKPLRGAELPAVANAWDALGGFALTEREREALRPRGKWAALLPTVPEGMNYLHHTPRGAGAPLFGWRTRYWSFLLKLAKDAPSWTLQAAPGPATGPFHWDNRLLSRQELCALQTFPPGFEVMGTPNAVRRQIGNAVPSALAEAVAHQVRRQLTGVPVEGIITLAVAPRADRPGPAAPGPLPAHFLNLAGSHPDHPGEGRGPGARRRTSGASEFEAVDPLVIRDEDAEAPFLSNPGQDLVAA